MRTIDTIRALNLTRPLGFDANLPFANGLGVHDNEGAFRFSVTTAAGFLLEVGHGTKIVTTPWQGNRKYDSISRWGHQPLPERTIGDEEISVGSVDSPHAPYATLDAAMVIGVPC